MLIWLICIMKLTGLGRNHCQCICSQDFKYSKLSLSIQCQIWKKKYTETAKQQNERITLCKLFYPPIRRPGKICLQNPLVWFNALVFHKAEKPRGYEKIQRIKNNNFPCIINLHLVFSLHHCLGHISNCFEVHLRILWMCVYCRQVVPNL